MNSLKMQTPSARISARSLTAVAPAVPRVQRSRNLAQHRSGCPCGTCAGRNVSAKAGLFDMIMGKDKSEGKKVSTTTAATSKAADAATVEKKAAGSYSELDLTARHNDVKRSFPSALSADDFLARTEVLLAGHGFTGDNSIAMTNLCRDEVTTVLKDKIEAAFGSSFNTNGLGGVLTCGCTGMGAGFSHSPICTGGRERYLFFSFPHIGIDASGKIGAISRPGRAGTSCACGALQKALNEFKAEGYEAAACEPGNHDAMDPEYSILKQRLARRLVSEKTNLDSLDLASLTAVAERTITSDMEGLISQVMDTKKADYAVITGVQIHNWATDLSAAPSMEMAAPTTAYVVVNGQKTVLDFNSVPALSPRQLQMLAAGRNAGYSSSEDIPASASSNGAVLQAMTPSYMNKRVHGTSMNPTAAVPTVVSESELAWQLQQRRGKVPAWVASVSRDVGAPNMESV